MIWFTSLEDLVIPCMPCSVFWASSMPSLLKFVVSCTIFATSFGFGGNILDGAGEVFHGLLHLFDTLRGFLGIDGDAAGVLCNLCRTGRDFLDTGICFFCTCCKVADLLVDD